MDIQKFLTPVLWTLFQIFVIFLVVAILLGFVIGFFTYDRPVSRRKGEGWLDDALSTGIGLSHAFIDFLFKKTRGRRNWLDDQQILAMMRGMNPTQFGEFVAGMFRALGHKVKVVGGAGDRGIDIAMMKGGKRYIVQCKKFIHRKVTPHDVRDFFGAMGDQHIDGKGFLVTTNIFTLEAERQADNKPIELIDGNHLVQLVRESGVLALGNPST